MNTPILTEADKLRLGDQLQSVLRFVSDRQYHTLREISEATGHPEASVSARLREITAKGLGQKRAMRRGGTWFYCILPPPVDGQARLF